MNFKNKHISYSSVKRFIDVIISFIVLIIVSPVIPFILFISFLQTKEFPILRQKRFISFNKPFINIYKIRTIRNANTFPKPYNTTLNPLVKKEQFIVPFFANILGKLGLMKFFKL